MTIVSDATILSITYDCHFDYSRGVIYDCNIFIVQAPGHIFSSDKKGNIIQIYYSFFLTKLHNSWPK
jgi:hypothetical protein